MSVDHTVVSIGTVRSSDQSPDATYNVHQFVMRKFVHPKYLADMESNPRQLHDIAVLQLARPVKPSQHRRPICISSPPKNFTNISAYVTGFGAYNSNSNNSYYSNVIRFPHFSWYRHWQKHE
ncbi:hypothetical protein OESDEN_03374 [Oesophagostomum dentatum]|uniref:Peptidase S1 domain-containing protein n=1 Tax=Oesophagostomum dentatum TaxID=61180 RepID=A0A0B1TLJ3_OESDE|nr:hypothetical protein OESDEN_03374 [Oesophagostomum dentatum]